MFWPYIFPALPYICLVLAALTTMLLLAGVTPAAPFATAAVLAWALFAVTTLFVFRKYGL